MTADSQDGYTPLNAFSLKAILPQMIFAQPRNVHSILEKHHARLGQANVHLLERQTADRSSDQPSLVLGECSLASLTTRIIWKAVSDFPRSIDRIDPPFRPPRLELVAGILVFVHLISQWCFCVTILGHAWFSTNKLYFLSGKLTLKSMGVTHRIDSSSLHLSPGLLNHDVHMKYARPIPCVLLTTSYYGEQARFAIQIDHELGSHASSDRAWSYTIPWSCSFVVFLTTFVVLINLFSLMPNQILGRAPMIAVGSLSGSLAHLTWILLLRRGRLLELSDLENASESIGDFLMTRRAAYKSLIVITIAIFYGFNQPIACLVLIITFATSICLFHLSKQVVLSESKTIQQFARRREIQAEKLTKQLAPKLLAKLPVGIAS